MEETKFRFDKLDEAPLNNDFDEKEFWLKNHYPLTVITDRYDGTYSGGKFTALPCNYWEIPADGPDGSDIPCSIFWDKYVGYCGLGDSPEAAIQHLIDCVKKSIHYNELNLWQ